MGRGGALGHDPAAVVEVRVGVVFRHRPIRRPPRVPEAGRGLRAVRARLVLQILEVADRAEIVEALVLAASHHPDVVILDLGLPGIDGVEVIRRIRSEPALKRLRIIALTGDVTRTRLQNVFEAGADRFVATPFRIPELLDAVRTMLRSPG